MSDDLSVATPAQPVNQKASGGSDPKRGFFEESALGSDPDFYSSGTPYLVVFTHTVFGSSKCRR